MDKSILILKDRVRNIKCIFDDINDEKEEIIKDYHELSDELFNFFKSKDIKWLNKFHDMIKSFIEMGFIFDSNDDIKNIMLKSKDINSDFLNYFFDGLKLQNVKNIKVENELSDEENDDNYMDMDIDIEEINNNNNEKFFDNFKWHNGQIEALKKIKENDFKSGIISMITGSGKSLIFLNTIHQHIETKKPSKGSIYVLMCPRIDILRSLFFINEDNTEYKLNINKINEWKTNNIINLDKLKIIDCINHKDKNLNFSKSKYNLLLVNNDFFRSLYKIKKIKDNICKNTNFIIIDECHCISGDKIYQIIEEIKYNYNIPIIGFSATPIRNTAKSDKHVIQIFSKSDKINEKNKKINLIYSYDLLQGIKDDIVLPYRIECVKINKIKGHKIGFTNKDILNNILKNCIDNKTKKLPYKKFIIWTNRKNIMSECYKYVEKNFKQLKVYCTSSFDKEFQDNGFNVNYEEFYKSNGDCVLICINKCKEGSDIPNIDCGIYFDGVKNRSILVHIQTSGRLIRHDKYGKKTHGDLIDTFILNKNETPYILTAQKILSYLTRLLNLSDDDYEDQIEYYNHMAKLTNNIEYNSTEKKLKIKIDGNDKHDTLIELNKLEILEMDWMKIKKELIKQVDTKFGITDEQKFNIIITKLKKIKEFNKYCDFWKVYDEIKEKYKLPCDLQKEFKNKFEENTWYDLLDIDTNGWYKNYEKIKNIVGQPFDKKKYKIVLKKNKKLPPYPEYLIKNFWHKHSNNTY